MYCQNCGSEIPEGYKFCFNCGALINGEKTGTTAQNSSSSQSSPSQQSAFEQARPPKKPKKKRKALKIVLIVFTVIIVLVIGALAYMATHEPPPSEPLSENTTTSRSSYSTTAPTTTVPTTNRLPTREEYKEMCRTVDYKDIERNPSEYEGMDVKFTGQVIQVSEEDEGTTYRISVTKDEYGNYDDPVLVYYEREEGETRVLEDDIVTFYGECRGVFTYESVLGGQITIPAVYALILEIED